MDITLRDVIIMAVSLAVALLLVSGCSKKVLHSTPPAGKSTAQSAKTTSSADTSQVGQPVPETAIPTAESTAETSLSDASSASVASSAVASGAPAPLQGADAYEEEGLASWYGSKFHGKHTASGEVFDANKYTAAHRVLPFGSMVEVTNLENGKRVVVRINDRGPFTDIEHRIIDLSRASAESVGMGENGLARVRIRRVDDGGQAGPAAADETVKSVAETAAPVLPGAVPVQTGVAEKVEITKAEVEKTVIEKKDAAAESASSAQTAAEREEAVLVDTKEEWIAAGTEQGTAVVESVEQTEVVAVKASQTAASPGGELYVQVGSFTDEANANKVLADLRTKGYPGSRIVSVDRDGKKFMRVQAGPFSGRGEAEAAVDQLKSSYPGGLVTY